MKSVTCTRALRVVRLMVDLVCWMDEDGDKRVCMYV